MMKKNKGKIIKSNGKQRKRTNVEEEGDKESP
jgi:hypothetical protein